MALKWLGPIWEHKTLQQFLSFYSLHCFSNCAHDFTNKVDGNIFNEIQNDLRTDLIELIRYLDNLLDKTFTPNNDNVTTLHIHIYLLLDIEQINLDFNFSNLESFFKETRSSD